MTIIIYIKKIQDNYFILLFIFKKIKSIVCMISNQSEKNRVNSLCNYVWVKNRNYVHFLLLKLNYFIFNDDDITRGKNMCD